MGLFSYRCCQSIFASLLLGGRSPRRQQDLIRRRTWSITIGLSFLLLASSSLFVLASTEPPAVTVRRTAEAPSIDGRLGEPVWESALTLTGFRERQSGLPADVQTTVRVTYDDAALYFGIRCEEPNPAGLVTQADTEMKTWSDDAVAILLEVEPESDTYYQLAVTAGGMDFDQKVTPGGKLYGEYEPDWNVQVVAGDDHWTAEAAVPFGALDAGPQMGKTWRLNVFRLRQQAEDKLSFWVHATGAHSRHRWGRLNGLVFGAESPAGLRLAQAHLGSGNVGSNLFAASFAEELPAQCKATLAIRAPSGHTRMFRMEDEGSRAAEGTRIEIPYRLAAEEGVHRLILRLDDREGGLLYRSPPGEIDLRGLLDSYVERNYYTSEDAARVVCLAPALDAETLQTAAFEATLGDTRVHAKVEPPLTQRITVDLPLKDVPDGDHRVHIVLREESGRTVASQELSLRKLPPGAGSEVKIVRRDNGAHLLVDGKPYLMLGTDLHGYPGDLVELVREAADAGFTMLAISGGTYYRGKEALDELKRVLDAGLKHGVHFVLNPENMYRSMISSRYRLHRDLPLLLDKYAEPSPEEPERVKTVRRLVSETKAHMRRFMTHPALLAWRGVDEGSPEQCVPVRRLIHEVDPYHPVERVFGPGGISERVDEIDIYMVHRYLHTDAPMSTPYGVARKSKVIADEDRKPLHAFPGSLTSGSLRGMTYPEIRCQLYLGLIGGWRGICWFRGRHLYLECWESVKRATHEAAQLMPVLMEEDVPQDMTVEQPDDNPVYWTLMRHRGRRWILAANARKKDVSVAFSLPEMKEGTTVKVWFEDRELRSQDNMFSDTFDAYGVHVYEINE